MDNEEFNPKIFELCQVLLYLCTPTQYYNLQKDFNMKKLLYLAVITVFISACSGSSDKQTPAQPEQNTVEIFNDMENAAAMVPSWINEITVVKMENGQAHSGEFVSRVDNNTLYTYAYRENFENINSRLPKKIIVNGWINSPDPADGLGMVMDINENNVSYLWKSYSLKSTVTEPNKWFEFTAYFDIDKPIKPEHQVKLFGFGGGKTAYFDDFRITFEY